MDWAVLPPEINSARMYAGPGSAPLIAAATGWAALAAQLGTTAADFGGVVDGLTATWLGPSSLAMMTSAPHYRSWLMVTAEQAMQTAVQAQAAVAAYETAFAATVPPPLIAANRAQLMALTATNFLGINTPAIMATEAQYMEMWAQDVAAMFGYQAASASASQLTPFTPPAPTTTGVQPTGISQAAGGAGSVLPDLSSFMPQSFSDLTGAAQALTGLAQLAFSPVGAVMDEGLWGSPQWPSPASAAATDAAGADAAAEVNAMTIGMPGVNAPNVAVNLGGASAVGRLSVPQSWSTAVEKPPVVALNTTPILPGSEGSPGMPGVPGMFPPVAKGGTPERVRYGFPVKNVIHNHPSGG